MGTRIHTTYELHEHKLKCMECGYVARSKYGWLAARRLTKHRRKVHSK